MKKDKDEEYPQFYRDDYLDYNSDCSYEDYSD